MKIYKLETSRLRLSGWEQNDINSLYELNSSADVMRYFPSILNKEQNAQFLTTVMDKFAEQGGWGLWKIELKESGEFIGFVGLNIPTAQLPFSPCVELGWRLLPKFWRYGYTTEAAREVIKFAFEQLHLDELVAFTTVTNTPSEGVMKKLGMTKDTSNFMHPLLPHDHPFAEHVLYRLKKPL
ncbi:GNAT family N-acetyltransferase [Providencia rustigianii]|uniref:GNAT family N-acetyltransferase n=1 Tax=Providencia rustigianii TaxID=158850 RepID=UPI000D9DBDFD|nr:GNAT family N-acetyltransferase [Providencia rustigianii]SPY77140.1 anhydro-N-acetylmuramic acid kinase [Providencia rustigianii]